MTSKTISLTGTETKVEYSGGCNAWLRNDGTAAIYASAAPEVTAGADGVVSIPAGQAAPIYGANGTVYLLGTGSVMFISSDYAECPFKTSTSSGGSGGVDDVARAAIEAHTADTDIHATAEEKAGWNGLSNPNLLINPDFRNPVNQRGLTEYASAGYTVDRWRLSLNGDLKINEGSITVTSTNNSPTYFLQPLEDYNMLDGMDATLTVCDENNNVYTATGKVPTGTVAQHTAILTVTFGVCQFILWKRSDGELLAQVHIPAGKSASIKWVKLEAGAIATPFVPLDYGMELAKCQRYYQLRSTNDIDPVDLRPSMGAITDIKAAEGGYAYVAEL